MKRLLMLLAVLSIGYVAGAALPGVILAQGGQAREGGPNPTRGAVRHRAADSLITHVRRETCFS